MKIDLSRYCLFKSSLQFLLSIGEKTVEPYIVFVGPSNEFQRALNKKSTANNSTISRYFSQGAAAIRTYNAGLVDVETVIRNLYSSRQTIGIQSVVITKTEMTIQGRDGVEVTTGWEDARVFIQVNVSVLTHHDQIHHARLDICISTLLTEARFRTWRTANARTLMTAFESAGTALRARNPVTGSSTGHAAFAMGTARGTLLIGTRSAWLRA